MIFSDYCIVGSEILLILTTLTNYSTRKFNRIDRKKKNPSIYRYAGICCAIGSVLLHIVNHVVAVELRVATARDVDPEVEVVGGFEDELVVVGVVLPT